MAAVSQRRSYRDGVNDTDRWDAFEHRPGDIFVATPAKCGTTWTQTIVASLLFPEGDAPAPVIILSPWLDGRTEPAETVQHRLARQEHRRFIKTHTPADGVPHWPTASYIVVLRDGRDAFMSLLNHMARMRPEFVAAINAEAEASGGRPLAWTGDPHLDFGHWLGSDDSVPVWLASWWTYRAHTNVLFVHYNDLKADLAGEMRRIAAFLDIVVPDDMWPAVVERCTFEAMKARPDEIGPFEFAFEGGADGFLFKGTNGRWRDVLTVEEVARYQHEVAQRLRPDAAEWLEHGSLALGWRP